MLENYQRVYATVDLDAIRKNMEHMKANIAPETRMIGVIKTDGYGHGAVPIAKELEPLEFLFGFATATIEEALILRKSGIRKPVLILGYTFPYSYTEMIRQQIRPTVFRQDTIPQLKECVEQLRKENPAYRVKVHIAVDTGMTRIGIRPDDSGLSFVKQLLQTEEIEVKGIFTHFARADEADKTAAFCQLALFQNFIKRIQTELGYQIPVTHCSNSAGIVELQDANMDVVRAGITLYGLWPSAEVKQNIVSLQPALSLYSHIVYVKEVEEGVPVSYGGTFVTKKRMKIATIPVGYGDGYPRGLSGNGYVLIRGKKAGILGRVCMDQFMVDVTKIPDAAEGDLVTLIGRDGTEQITMEQLGELSGRFNYELACDLGKRIPRVYLKDKEILSTKDYYQDF